MTTAAHEQAHHALNTMFLRKCASMNGLHLELQVMGQVAITSNGVTKKPDQSYRPTVLPQTRSDRWPTVVIECAYSQNRSKLAEDARWWLLEAGGAVKTALNITVHETEREVTIENWESIPRGTRQDENKKVAEITQRVVMSQKTVNDPIRVTGYPLTLPFEHFFLRPANPGEGDIVLDNSDMETIAKLVWNIPRFKMPGTKLTTSLRSARKREQHSLNISTLAME
ncbi:uncharacterized protein CDV56_106149 [Aspergillus thermomutatus]|uniref:Uncharacterized protein n=1 Tax=Aspergillus thermomutatus TaxID=41047 RepID=A0A397GEQ2_ASPTH|nr:uncharacterized protein CDV56_106149 [Aspergillus thermomutatus]RHZ48589.1 hypothetical protein CDV56_106149 [Aspergillus thermomutatus]